MAVKRGRLLIDDKPYEKVINPPKPADVFRPDKRLWSLGEEIDMVKGEDEVQAESKFIAYAAAVQDHADIQAAYVRVKTKFASASHIVCAYRLPGKETHTLQDFADDGEIGAGRVILNVLKEELLMNVAVFMIRFHGGRNLGPTRFELIKKVSQSAIQNLRAKSEKMKKEEEEKRLQDLAAQAQAPIPEWSEWTTPIPQQGRQHKIGKED